MKSAFRMTMLVMLVLGVMGTMLTPSAAAADGDLATVGFATGEATFNAASAQDDEEVDEIVDDIVDEVERIERVRAAEEAMNRILCSLGVTSYCGLSASFDENVSAFAPAGLPLAQYSCSTVSCAGYNYGSSWGHRLCWAQYGIHDPRCYYA